MCGKGKVAPIFLCFPFLRARNSGDKDVHCGKDGRRPPVPKATDHIATPYRTRRNFVHKNALDAMLSEPPGGKDSSGDSSDACYVDSPRGNTQVIFLASYFKVCQNKNNFCTLFQSMPKQKYVLLLVSKYAKTKIFFCSLFQSMPKL